MGVLESKAKQPKADNKNEAVGKKKNGKVIIIGVVCLLMAACVSLIVLSATQNLFGGRDAVIGFFGSMDPQYRSVQQREEALAQREKDVTAKEEAAEKKEQKLSQMEAELKTKTENVGRSSFETYLADLTEERLSQLKQISSIYSGMDAKLAAEALTKLGSADDMAVVIYYMDEKNAAALMNSLDAGTAARVTQSMLG